MTRIDACSVDPVMRALRLSSVALASVALASALLAVALTAEPARAEGGFRCGTGRVIRNGETEDDVATKCGDPDAVRTWTEMQTETVWQDGRAVERQVAIVHDEWKYDLGQHRLIRYLNFTNGRLRAVTTGGYGE